MSRPLPRNAASTTYIVRPERSVWENAGLEGAGVTAKPLHRELAALRYDLDGPEQDDRGEREQDQCDDIHTASSNRIERL